MTDDPTPAPAGDGAATASPASDAPATAEPARGRSVRVWLERGGGILAGLVLAAIIGGYALPREPEVTRSIDIARPRAAVFPLVADLRHLPDWWPRLTADPAVAVTFTGPLDGVGQSLTWESKTPAVGSGVETITAIDLDQSVAMRVAVAGQSENAAWFRLDEKGPGVTTVVWGVRTDLGLNPIRRYRGLTLDRTLGPDYELGLKRLKALAETPPPAD